MSFPSQNANSLDWQAADETGTDRLGRCLARALRPGDVVALHGPLGAGKTRLVRSIATALGLAEQTVTSPTFVLVHEYDGPLPMYHIDAYRLRGSGEFLDIGGDELLWGGRVCLIEWAERIADLLPADHLRIDIAATGAASRRFRLKASGPRSRALLADLGESLRQTSPGGPE